MFIFARTTKRADVRWSLKANMYLQPGNYRTLVTLKSPCGEIMETELDADGDGRIVIDHRFALVG